jgi:hypothetical protein
MAYILTHKVLIFGWFCAIVFLGAYVHAITLWNKVDNEYSYLRWRLRRIKKNDPEFYFTYARRIGIGVEDEDKWMTPFGR